ncbi:helix-turn-helix domain-containing protein [Natronosalvus vescus]|uniref:helix-turn-helix domain-containing protein n=1 Tax=Natronosalvus vescus TaxID=2953881 RepID=UPI0020917FF1|nr:helix-turn-helix domain-containing protein [Natronosalvus vescus]
MNTQDAHEILANADRRHILTELSENDGFTTISDLATILVIHSETRVETDKALENAKIRLVHNHLPRLEDHGIIEYDNRSGDVILTASETRTSLLDTAEEGEAMATETAEPF